MLERDIAMRVKEGGWLVMIVAGGQSARVEFDYSLLMLKDLIIFHRSSMSSLYSLPNFLALCLHQDEIASPLG